MSSIMLAKLVPKQSFELLTRTLPNVFTTTRHSVQAFVPTPPRETSTVVPVGVSLDGDKEENSIILKNKQQEKYVEKLKTSTVKVDEPNLLSTVSGVPEEHVLNRRVRIFKQSKNAMQSGTFDTKLWKLDFENRERWENPLMGWTSTGDPLSNLNLSFSCQEDAIAYCESHGYYYEIEEAQERRKLKKTYAENFSWNKRTRIGSK